MNFKVQCLIKKKISILNLILINLYTLKTDFTLCSCLFGSVKLTNNTNLDKYKYTDYTIGFYSCSEFLFTGVSYGKNAI